MLHRHERCGTVRAAILPAGKILQRQAGKLTAKFKSVLLSIGPQGRVDTAADGKNAGPAAAL